MNEQALAHWGLSRQKETKDKTGVLGVTPCVLVNGFQRFIKHAAWSVGVYGHDVTTKAAHSLYHHVYPLHLQLNLYVLEEVTCLKCNPTINT